MKQAKINIMQNREVWRSGALVMLFFLFFYPSNVHASEASSTIDFVSEAEASSSTVTSTVVAEPSLFNVNGNLWNITASTSTFPLGTTTILSTWRYNFSDISNEWIPDGGDTIDISVPNPAPQNALDTTITTATLKTDDFGIVQYLFSATGTYYAKITSQDYSKWSNTLELKVLDVPITAISIATSTPVDVIDNINSILNFLKSRQTEDGKIVNAGTTDWAIMSFASHNEYPQDIKKGSRSLFDYIVDDVGLDKESNVCAAYSRRILAFEASGLTAQSSQILPLINHLKEHCGSTGDQNLSGINDDIFIIFALLSTGEDSKSELIEGLKLNILKEQDLQSGAFYSFGSLSPDMTGAAINALVYIKNKGGAVDDNAMVNAKKYLHATQLFDGGWNAWDTVSDPITTTWAMEGINALQESQSDWANSKGATPWSYLTDKVTDKGYYESPWDEEGIDWFGTKHAVPALLGKMWPIILSPRENPPPAQHNEINNVGVWVNQDYLIVPITQTTSTLLQATSTLVQATSTLPIFSTSTPVILNTTGNFDTIVNTSPAESLPSESNSSLGSVPVILKRKAISESQELIPAVYNSQTDAQENILTSNHEAENPLLPIEKKVAQTAAAGSAIVFGGTSLLLLIRLLLAAL